MPARTCPTCDAELKAEILGGQCPQCVLHKVMADQEGNERGSGDSAKPQVAVVTTVALTEKPEDHIGRRKLLQRLGEGIRYSLTKPMTDQQVIVVIALAVALLVGAALLVDCHRIQARPAGIGASACSAFLIQLDGAKQLWAQENAKTSNDTPTWDDLRPYFGGRGATGAVVACPADGIYTLGRVGQPPTCSIGGPRHSLDQHHLRK